ncbi:MAG: hypothetical protein QG672_718 [Pseudomonadota bacterium]|nr:hypothetical protein [Pseudomonadota bacterium]
MTAATGSLGSRGLFRLTSVLTSAFVAAVLTFSLAACQPADRAVVQKRVEAKWVDRQLLFVGDPRLGTVRIYHLRAAPLMVGELRAPGRNEVRDISLDTTNGRIWVLGDGALYLHDARTYSLVKRIPAVGSGTVRVALDAAGAPLLIAENGTQLARVDLQTLTLQRQQLAEGVR